MAPGLSLRIAVAVARRYAGMPTWKRVRIGAGARPAGLPAAPRGKQDGWAGVAFVNVESADAQVILSAVDDNGNEVARETIKLTPGKKSVGIVYQLFTGDISSAEYFKYSSDKKLLGFTVSGSGDGAMLDGVPSLPQYFRIMERQP